MEKDLPAIMGLQPRVEKHGGSVSQPHSWVVARLLLEPRGSIGLPKCSYDEGALVECLRAMESESSDMTSSLRPTVEVENIRAIARTLWSRRVGVVSGNQERTKGPKSAG